MRIYSHSDLSKSRGSWASQECGLISNENQVSFLGPIISGTCDELVFHAHARMTCIRMHMMCGAYMCTQTHTRNVHTLAQEQAFALTRMYKRS